VIETGDLRGPTEIELVARMVESAAVEGGWYEAEQMGHSIAKLGEGGVRVLESLVDHPSEDVAAGSLHGLREAPGWPEQHAATLVRLVFGQRPAVMSFALDALRGYADGYVCYLPEIADRVADELAAHESSRVRSAAIAYLSVCAPRRHVDRLIAGLSDDDASVRTVAVARLAYLDDSELLEMAGSEVWHRLDDDDLHVRDSAQDFLETHAWPSPFGPATVALTDDESLLAYGRTRVELHPVRDPPLGHPLDLGAFAGAIERGQPQAVRCGAADELWEQTILVDDIGSIAAFLVISERCRDDADPRVAQALAEAMTFVKDYK